MNNRYIPQQSPDYNFFINNGNSDRIAANRVALSVFTEYGLMNNKKPGIQEFNAVISNIQQVTINHESTKRM